MKDTAEAKKSTVQSSYPNFPGSSGLIDTGYPNPRRMGAVDSLKSSLPEDAVIRLEMGFNSKQTSAQCGKNSILWMILSPCPILTEPAFTAI